MASDFSQTAFAELIGYSTSTIARWIADGMPAERGTTKQGHRIDAAKAVRWMIDRAVHKATGGGKEITYDSERLRLTKEQADKQEIENERERGHLCHTDQVLEVVTELAAETANELKSIGARTCQEQADDGTPSGCKAVTDRECIRVRNTLADTVGRIRESLQAT